MAGHSKFKNIMHRKGRQDKKRAKIYSRIGREITVAAKNGPDPKFNPALRLAIQNARSENMPKENIERAIKKAEGGDAEAYKAVRYEGFGPGGVGIIVEALTDNLNRTAGSLRSIFSKGGGNMGETGSVSFQFDRLGQIEYPASVGSEDAVMEAALEAGAEDVVSDADTHLIYTAMADLSLVSEALAAQFGDPQSTSIVWKPKNTVPVSGDDVATLMKLIDTLDDDDDVQTVSANFDISDEDLAKLDV